MLLKKFSLNALLRPSSQTPSIPFMHWRKTMLIVSLCLMLFSIIFVVLRGVNFGIDFRGGLLVEFETKTPPDLAQLRRTLRNATEGNLLLQEFDSDTIFLLRIQKPRLQRGEVWNPQNSVDKIKNVLEKRVVVLEYRRLETVGPAVGKELRRAAVLAVAFALLGIMAYIWLRFEWQFALAAVIALLHDVIATIGFFALLQLEFTLASVAAILTIAGYSINDTVVIFDRIRENMRKYKKMEPLALLNLALNQTLSRTILTSITTLLAIAALVLFGGAVISDFALALGWGLIVGTYSSVGLAAPILAILGGDKTLGSSEDEHHSKTK